MHRDDEVPTPVLPAIVRPSLLHSVGNVLAGLALLYAVVFLLRWWMTPLPMPTATTPASSTTGQSFAPSSFASPPPELIQMAVAISTSLAPTPTPIPPTPTYSMLPTPRAISVCLTSTPKGDVCSQPKPPLPTSTPMAACPVSPGELCVWRGGPVTWLATPTPAPSTSSNQ